MTIKLLQLRALGKKKEEFETEAENKRIKWK
jgi:hypothetical protein